MKNPAYEEFGEAPDIGISRFARIRVAMSTIIGAVVALGILIAMGTWFYRLGAREAGDVPIIRAAAGPAKTRPDDPGGLVTPHQNVTSFEAAGSGAAELTVALIAPAPPEPKPEDLSLGALAPQSKPATVSTAESAERGAEAPAEAGAETAEPGDTDETAEDEASTGPAPNTSPIAPRRPVDLAARMKAAVAEAVNEVTELATRAANSPFQIQLAADPSEQVINKIWRKVLGANKDILRDRTLAVQSTVSGGTTYYRLRVGPFSTREEAISVCQALKARKQDCIVARNS